MRNTEVLIFEKRDNDNIALSCGCARCFRAVYGEFAHGISLRKSGWSNCAVVYDDDSQN